MEEWALPGNRNRLPGHGTPPFPSRKSGTSGGTRRSGSPSLSPLGEADTEIPGTRKTARTARPLWGRGLPLSPVKGLQPLDRVAAPDAEAEVVVIGVDVDVLGVADLPADDVLGERGFHV